MTAYDIVIRPIITERAMAGAADKKYVFEVAKNAGKIEIKKAVEEIFGVKVASVNTLNVPGKQKRMGAARPGMTRSWNAFNFSPLRIMFAVGLSYIAFIMLRYVPSIPAFWSVFIINGF